MCVCVCVWHEIIYKVITINATNGQVAKAYCLSAYGWQLLFMEITHNLDFPMWIQIQKTNANKQATKLVQSSTMQQRQLMINIYIYKYIRIYVFLYHALYAFTYNGENEEKSKLAGQSVVGAAKAQDNYFQNCDQSQNLMALTAFTTVAPFVGGGCNEAYTHPR